VEAGNDKKADRISIVSFFPAQNANALPLAGASHSAQQQVLRLNSWRGAGTSRSIFSLKSRAASWGLTRTIDPCFSPSGASTSPESGIEVSMEEYFLSREKRKMWLTFSYCVYL